MRSCFLLSVCVHVGLCCMGLALRFSIPCCWKCWTIGVSDFLFLRMLCVCACSTVVREFPVSPMYCFWQMVHQIK